MAPISFVIDILLRWVMMLRTRMTRRSGGCRWRSNVGETRRRCGRRDRDWSCRVTVWQTQPAPETNLPAWATLTLTVMKTSWRRRRRLWLSNSGTRWLSDRRSASLLSQMGSGRLSLVHQVQWLVSYRERLRTRTTRSRRYGACSLGPAPPQIALTVQNILAKWTPALRGQRWMCAVFRWCHFLSKYFCTGCQLSLKQQRHHSCQDYPAVELQQVLSIPSQTLLWKFSSLWNMNQASTYQEKMEKL